MTTLDLEPIKARLAAARRLPVSLMGCEVKKAIGNPKSIYRWAFDGTWNDANLCAHAPSDLAALISEVERLRGQTDAVRALHRPAHAVFSWNGGTRYEDPCPQCHGAPGVHPCGCWADTQLEYVCAECHRLGVISRGVYDYPCPTIRALEVGE